MSSVSLVYGHMFTRRELLRATDLNPLTVDNLREYLQRNTSRLDVEAYQSDNFGEGLDLRTGRFVNNPVCVPVAEMKNIAALVGVCLVEHSGENEVLKVERLYEMLRSSDGGTCAVRNEFEEVFRNRTRWMLSSFSTYLVGDSKERSLNGKRVDYPIIGV